MLKLTRKLYVNPFFFEDRMITSIVLYNDNGIVCSIPRGWFGSGDNNMVDWELNEIHIRRKENLTKKENY